LAVIAVALLSLYICIRTYTPRSEHFLDPYGIAELRERFKVLDGVVPPETLLGYVSDLQPDSATVFGVEYAIAPRMLVQDGVPHRFVLGNFSQPTDYAKFGLGRGLVVVKEFPKGVVLYETQATQ
jgi:hypothetical protein